MKGLTSLLIFCTVMGFALPRAMGERSALFNQIMGPPASEADLSIIPPDKLEALKRELRDSAQHELGSGDDRSSLYLNPGPATLLVRLGDSQMIEFLSGSYFTNPSGAVKVCDIAEAAGRPQVIPAFAKYLYYPPTSGGVSGGDVVIFPTVDCARLLICRTIRKSPEFSPRLKDWTKTMEYKFGPDVRRGMQLWWEHNQDHFKAAEYDKVEPWPAGS